MTSFDPELFKQWAERVNDDSKESRGEIKVLREKLQTLSEEHAKYKQIVDDRAKVIEEREKIVERVDKLESRQDITESRSRTKNRIFTTVMSVVGGGTVVALIIELIKWIKG